MKQFLRAASFFFILSVFLTHTAFAQHPVIFETFTNNCEPHGTAANTERNNFNTLVSQTITNEKSKIIHLDNHIINLCDYVYSTYASIAAGYVLPPGNQVFWGAVDRTVFNSTSTRGSSSSSDWSSTIESEYNTSPSATISLVNATLDKTNGNSFKLSANVQITLAQDISDSLIIRCVLVQDDIHDTLDGTSNGVTLNDVVRYISTSNAGNYTVFPTGGSSGTQKNVTLKVSLAGDSDKDYYPLINWAKMRLIVFLEESSDGTDFHVVNAADLKDDLDTLQLPPPTLSLNESSITMDTLHPSFVAQITYNSTNLVNGVDAYYSLDNGTTWRFIAHSSSSPVNWTVPDSLTTQGKIQLIATGVTPPVVSTEVGNFTIAVAPNVTILQPQQAQVLKGGSFDTIVWTQVSVTGDTLKYYLADANGGFSVSHMIGHVTGTSFIWSVPDTNRVVEIQLLPDNHEAPAASVIDTIESATIINPNSVSNGAQPLVLAITSIYPNPAANGAEIVVQYSEATPKPVTMQLLDLLGREMPRTYTTNNQEIHLNTNSLAAGAYVVRLSDGVNTVSKRVEVIR